MGVSTGALKDLKEIENWLMSKLLVLIWTLNLVINLHFFLTIFRVLNFNAPFSVSTYVFQNCVIYALLHQFVELLTNFNEFTHGTVEHAETILYFTDDFRDVLHLFLISMEINVQIHTNKWQKWFNESIKVTFARAMPSNFLHNSEDTKLCSHLKEVHLL